MQTAFIQCQADIMSGTPVFADSRVPVRTLVKYLEAGETIADFLEGFQQWGVTKCLPFSMQQSVTAEHFDVFVTVDRNLFFQNKDH